MVSVSGKGMEEALVNAEKLLKPAREAIAKSPKIAELRDAYTSTRKLLKDTEALAQSGKRTIYSVEQLNERLKNIQTGIHSAIKEAIKPVFAPTQAQREAVDGLLKKILDKNPNISEKQILETLNRCEGVSPKALEQIKQERLAALAKKAVIPKSLEKINPQSKAIVKISPEQKFPAESRNNGIKAAANNPQPAQVTSNHRISSSPEQIAALRAEESARVTLYKVATQQLAPELTHQEKFKQLLDKAVDVFSKNPDLCKGQSPRKLVLLELSSRSNRSLIVKNHGIPEKEFDRMLHDELVASGLIKG